jgi:uncharacterized protein DUF6600
MKIFFVVLPPLLFTGCMYTRVEVPGRVPFSGADPPARVARLSYLSGPVSLRPGGTESWVAADLNRPLTTGDELWTDQAARAELDIGHAFVRLDSRTSIALLNLDDRGVQIKLSTGIAQIRLRQLDEEDEFELDTPQAAVSLLRIGGYRLEVNADGSITDLSVRTGQSEVNHSSQAFTVRAGQRARLEGTETVNHETTTAPPVDDFDKFCQIRDRRSEKAKSLGYVSQYVIGWEDLDEFGYWRVDAVHGPFWIPRVTVSGWAPYRYGHWVWIEPWGWTWIDDAPWGFAPFHYGRWIVVDGVWVWVPGPRHIRAVYAPALIVFIGGGPGLRYYFRIGTRLGVAWFPLGPNEVYIPPYRCSRVYVTNVNVSHTVIARSDFWKTDMTRQEYRNRRVAGSITAVRDDVFTSGRRISGSAVAVRPEDARSAHIGGSAPPVTPNRRSLSLEQNSDRPSPRPPDGTIRRPITVRRKPAEAPVPFEHKRPSLDKDPGRPPAPVIVDSGRRERRPVPEYKPATPRRDNKVAPPAPRTHIEPSRPGPTPKNTENRRRAIERERQTTNDGRPGRGK